MLRQQSKRPLRHRRSSGEPLRQGPGEAKRLAPNHRQPTMVRRARRGEEVGKASAPGSATANSGDGRHPNGAVNVAAEGGRNLGRQSFTRATATTWVGWGQADAQAGHPAPHARNKQSLGRPTAGICLPEHQQARSRKRGENDEARILSAPRPLRTIQPVSGPILQTFGRSRTSVSFGRGRDSLDQLCLLDPFPP